MGKENKSRTHGVGDALDALDGLIESVGLRRGAEASREEHSSERIS